MGERIPIAMRRFLLLFLMPVVCAAQSGDTLQHFTLTAAQARNDFQLYRRLLQETHPGLYRYTPKEQMQQYLDSVESSFLEPIAFYDYHRVLALVNANIRCAHSYTFPKGDSWGYMQSIKVLPVFIHPIQGKYIVLFSGTNDASILPGYELTHINGRSTDSIAVVLKKHFWSDGYNELAKNQVVQGSTFGLYYYMIIERPESFRLAFKSADGQKKNVMVKAQNMQVNEVNYKKNPVNKKIMSLIGKSKPQWDLLFPKDLQKSAILRIYGFGGKGQNTSDEARAAMRAFMDKSMKEINKRGVKNLIVDVRGNRGGWDTQGAELFTYLMKSDSPVYYYKRLHSITDSSEFLKYSDLSDLDRRNAKKELRAEADGTFSMRKEFNPDLQLQYPKSNRFKGQVYIMMNYFSASTASEFVAVCKSNTIGLLVGEESNGCYEGGNGASFISMTLPNSKIAVNTPLIYYENAVVPVSQKGRGTIPDFIIQESVDDVFNGRDSVLEWVKERIRNSQ